MDGPAIRGSKGRIFPGKQTKPYKLTEGAAAAGVFFALFDIRNGIAVVACGSDMRG
jgi:hypothetical protein